MRILDSNILIYSYSEEYAYLRELVWSQDSCVSEISRLEMLGFHSLNAAEELYFKDVFLLLKSHPIDLHVLDEAILLRKTYRMKLGDSIVAATALVHDLEILTRNTADLAKVTGLKVVNPIL